ncbi:MAG: type II toxin-antitoxin system VapC family toxin [Propionibacteriaceae bacterium]|nr:type II toxin-antitoxin system VapC family toxin [Propionibacteriaceae bacterium]
MRLLLDTSAALALVLKDNESHSRVRERVRGHELGLAGHARFETYSVLTRLPVVYRLSAASAALLLRTTFPASVTLSEQSQADLMTKLVDAGISGGAVWDGLVAFAALDAGIRLLSLDRRALPTYRALGADVELL